MSSPAVQTAVRALMTGGSWPGGVPYVETFSKYVDPDEIDRAFSTVRFQKPQTRNTELGTPWYFEEGEFEIQLFAEVGKSFAEINGAVDAVRPVVLGHLWPGSITIQAVEAPEVVSPGGGGLHVEATVEVRYTYEHGGA